MPSLPGGWSRLDNAALMYSALQRETFDGLTSFFQYLSEQLTTI